VEQPFATAFAPVASSLRRVLVLDAALIAVFSLVALRVARQLAGPLRALVDAARRIAEGETGVLIPDSGGGETGRLTRAFNQMTAQLHHNRSELEQSRREIQRANEQLLAQNQQLQRANEALKQLSITDALTRLHNHRFFQDHLPREMKRAVRTQEPLSLVLIDVDDFKQLNDRFGHAVGDAVLRRVAEVMNDNVREMDLLARYGGEEFALLASGTTLRGAMALAEKIRMAVARARFPVLDLDGQSEVRITVSIGVAAFRGDERAFFNDADRALYRAKETGKDCVVAADGSREGEAGASPDGAEA
jgi:diguanylate cyclase (GGDEF)-like protein